MPGISFTIHGQPAHLDFCGSHKPGDPPPEGYNEWHEWAKVQEKAGLKQERCGRCSKWRFPQELSDIIDTSEANTRKDGSGQTVIVKSPVCKQCAAKESP